MAQDPDVQWYSVRCVFRSESDEGPLYEERLTLWESDSLDGAIALAESEAEAYAAAHGSELLGLAQGYWLDGVPQSGAAVYALLRQSDLGPDDYLDAFFDTGSERESDQQ